MKYVPHRGDIIWMNFTPQKGHEQKGKRPALVISPYIYNKKTGLVLCCPITSQVKSYPFEVVIRGKKISGVVLSDHIKNLDWKARRAQFIEKASPRTIAECIGKLSTLIATD